MEREEEDENTFSLDWMVSAHAFKRRDRPDESATKNTVRIMTSPPSFICSFIRSSHLLTFRSGFALRCLLAAEGEHSSMSVRSDVILLLLLLVVVVVVVAVLLAVAVAASQRPFSLVDLVPSRIV